MNKSVGFLAKYKRKVYFSSCFLLSLVLLTSVYCSLSYKKEIGGFSLFLEDNFMMFIGIFLFSLLTSYSVLQHMRISELENIKKSLIKLNENLEKRNAELSELNLQVEKNNEKLIELNEKFQIDSMTDALTGLPNRRFFMNECEKNISESIKTNTSFFVIVLDIDHFKKINDTYGHLAGDIVLQHVAQILKDSLREKDIVARFGGEEFIIGLPKSNLIIAKSISERIRVTLINSKIKADKHTIRLTASLGISQYIHHEKNIEPAIKRADDALYEAKENGRNRVIVKL